MFEMKLEYFYLYEKSKSLQNQLSLNFRKWGIYYYYFFNNQEFPPDPQKEKSITFNCFKSIP